MQSLEITTDYFPNKSAENLLTKSPFQVSVIGSGNFASAIAAKVIALNCMENSMLFHRKVRMWVYEETIEGDKLSDIINTKHENVKYLPGIKLPKNLYAEPDLVECCKASNILVFCLPHQFLDSVLEQLKGHLRPGTRAISCLKGFEVRNDALYLLPDRIRLELGIHCGMLSGANLANEVAQEKFSETTIAYPLPDDYFPGDVDATVIYTLFHRPYFHVNVIDDIAGVSVAGALKNVVAITVGFVEGLGWGENAKAAIMRRGLLEMVRFGKKFFPDCKVGTFTEESAGVADLFTTCSGGRNVKVAMEMAITGKSAWDVEKDLLNGQSAQGIITAREVHDFLLAQGSEAVSEFPLLEATYQMIFNGVSVGILPYMLDNKWQIKPGQSAFYNIS